MTDTQALNDAINASGLKRGYIANALGVSHAGLINMINNRAEFRASHIFKLTALLRLTPAQRDAIFFAEIGG